MKKKFRIGFVIFVIIILGTVVWYFHFPYSDYRSIMLEIECYHGMAEGNNMVYAERWSVYYNGELLHTRMQENELFYTKKVAERKKGKLTRKELSHLYCILRTSFQLYYNDDEINNDEPRYDVTFYRSGGVDHRFTGYIVNRNGLQKIMEIIEKQTLD